MQRGELKLKQFLSVNITSEIARQFIFDYLHQHGTLKPIFDLQTSLTVLLAPHIFLFADDAKMTCHVQPIEKNLKVILNFKMRGYHFVDQREMMFTRDRPGYCLTLSFCEKNNEMTLNDVQLELINKEKQFDFSIGQTRDAIHPIQFQGKITFEALVQAGIEYGLHSHQVDGLPRQQLTCAKQVIFLNEY